jgi:hypothetical protein
VCPLQLPQADQLINPRKSLRVQDRKRFGLFTQNAKKARVPQTGAAIASAADGRSRPGLYMQSVDLRPFSFASSAIVKLILILQGL